MTTGTELKSYMMRWRDTGIQLVFYNLSIYLFLDPLFFLHISRILLLGEETRNTTLPFFGGNYSHDVFSRVHMPFFITIIIIIASW